MKSGSPALYRTFAVAAFLVFGACASKASTTPQEAASNPGSTRTVCARVADVVEDPVSDGPLHLYLDRPAPEQSLVVTIQDRRTAGNLRYLARLICVTGQVELSSEGPKIVVEKAAQVSVSGEAIPQFEVAEVVSHIGQAVRICGRIHSFESAPDSDLRATMVLGTGDPSSSLWVEILDRRGLEIAPGEIRGRACVTGYIRSDEQGRPKTVLRDPRELAVEK